MTLLPPTAVPGTEMALHGNVLGPAVRRDVTDLNRQFLSLCLAPDLAEDPRFRLPPVVLRRLQDCPPEALGRLAGSPVSLFTLNLPPEAALPLDPAGHVADSRAPAAGPGLAERCRTFMVIALAVGRRMAEDGRLSARIALGISPDTEARLAAMTPSELAAVATWPELVRPRWARHERYWAMLTSAACDPAAGDLQWAFCVGMCLPDPPTPHGVDGWPGARRRMRPR